MSLKKSKSNDFNRYSQWKIGYNHRINDFPVQNFYMGYRNDFFSLSLYVNTEEEEEEEEIFDDEIFVCCSPLYSIDK